MIPKNLLNVTKWLRLSAAACFVAFALVAQASTILQVTFDDLVVQSDWIVEGKVVSRESKAVKGRIETEVRIDLSKVYKGDVANPQLVLTTLGGRLKYPPIAQAVPGLATFGKDEEVILFLSTKPARIESGTGAKAKSGSAPALTALQASPQVIGGYQGKYSVYTDPKTGARSVVRQSAHDATGISEKDIPKSVPRSDATVKLISPEGKVVEAQRAAVGKETVPAAMGRIQGYDEFAAEILKRVGAPAARSVSKTDSKSPAAAEPKKTTP